MILKPETRKCLEVGLRRIESGWTKGNSRLLVNGEMHYCAIGAIIDQPASTYTDAWWTLVNAMKPEQAEKASVPDSCEANHGWIIRFNDDPTTTKEDVVQLFKRALTPDAALSTEVGERELVDA